VATIENGGFRNLSGQLYRAIVVPSSTVISRTGLERFQAFVKAGGKVIFVGKTPRLVVDKTFLNAKDAPDLSFATLIEPSGDITPRVIAALPKPDVALDLPCPAIKYAHRTWSDGDLYFFFNESKEKQSRSVLLAGRGQAQAWDLGEGLIHPIRTAIAEPGGVRLPLVLSPYEAKVIVIGPMPADVSTPEPSLAAGDVVAEIAVEPAQNGSAPSYSKDFTLAAKPSGKRLFLECDDVRDYARVRLNGVDLPARAWQPYRWDATAASKSGKNTLEIEVRGSSSGRGPAPVPANPGAAAAGGRGRAGGAPAPDVSGLLAPLRLVWRGEL
jgi:hypothetical protein